MVYLAIAFAVVALCGIIGARVWMIKGLRDARDTDERPFDHDDELRNPYQ
ncbi:hypothetical protein ACEE90_06210 [Corynebacterium phoceense]|nr:MULTISPECIES: hypothetical protein [Corynebacterium]KXB54667.1 hypothetical protein HMPREF0307_01413 [Corynebacterium sp. DNF00584]KXI19429.1 hypothetical protein HMPREF3227_00443 [Corynebacterium sp. CMW7794]MCQ9331557.1 hypothetical protein [Corynebacterium phoceense]MCQ9333616.1 hypothetical protein [Corynebacterium phoceense]MCQ9335248.1 hypothetical protein [Corynebacterium phoceense]